MHRSSKLEIPDHCDMQFIEFSLCFFDSKQINNRLRGMLVCSVSSVNDWNFCGLSSKSCTPFNRMPHHNNVSIPFNHFDRVSKAFSFLTGGDFRICKTNHASSQPFHGAFKTEACSRARFKE